MKNDSNLPFPQFRLLRDLFFYCEEKQFAALGATKFKFVQNSTETKLNQSFNHPIAH